MRQVNFKQVIEETLAAHAINETALAERVGCVQQTINKLRRGIIVQPNYALGAKLVAIWEARPLINGGARK